MPCIWCGEEHKSNQCTCDTFKMRFKKRIVQPQPQSSNYTCPSCNGGFEYPNYVRNRGFCPWCGKKMNVVKTRGMYY